MTPNSYLFQWKDLSADIVKHFQVLALTPECREILNDIAKKAISAEIEDDKLKIVFEAGYLVCEPPCTKEISNLPASYQNILKLHNGMKFFVDDDPQILIKGQKDDAFDEDSDDTMEVEYDEDSYAGSDDEMAKEAPLISSHDHFVFNDQEKTSFGEPTLSFYDPEMGYMDKPFSLEFSVGGYFLRQIGYEILDGDPRCEKIVEYASGQGDME